MTDLFSSAADDQLRSGAPIASRMRPERFEDVVGQKHLLGPGKPLAALIEAEALTSIILVGPPGVGKTTIARLSATRYRARFEQLSGVNASVKDVREVAERARRALGENGRRTILFLDEIHRFSRTQQDALLPHVEDGLLTLIGATTENPSFALNGPLLSRSTLFRLEPLSPDELEVVISRAARAGGPGGVTPVALNQEATAQLVHAANGDARRALQSLEIAAALAKQRGSEVLELDDAEKATSSKVVNYGKDQHYDIASAFIKSIRGSDVDAGLYWLARMLNAGDDPRFVARRLIILASEDIGMADSQALLVADSASRAVEFVGMPEARIVLSHCVIYLATAPKSNSAYTAISKALVDAEEDVGRVPIALRDTSYPGARQMGHGVGYKYPHDEPSAYVKQQYRPDGVVAHRYWEPTGHGRDLPGWPRAIQ